MIAKYALGGSQGAGWLRAGALCQRHQQDLQPGFSPGRRHVNLASKYYLHASPVSFFTSLFSCETCSLPSRKRYFLNIWSCDEHPYLSFSFWNTSLGAPFPRNRFSMWQTEAIPNSYWGLGGGGSQGGIFLSFMIWLYPPSEALASALLGGVLQSSTLPVLCMV